MSRLLRSRLSGALLRAALVALAIALPELLLEPAPGGPGPLWMLFAIIAALFTFSEYAADAPSLVEFRDARPYNRLLAGSVLASLLVACAMLRPDWSEAAPVRPFRWLGETWADLLDLPWSPVHQLLSTLPPEAGPGLAQGLFAAAATAYGLSLIMVVAFALAVRRRRWPGPSSFNVWINLPQFDPTTGGDVVHRLRQNALVNVALGLLLPLIVPIVMEVLALPFDGSSLRSPAALVWVVVAWAFVPGCLVMRGLALHRLALLIAEHRDRLRRASGPPLSA